MTDVVRCIECGFLSKRARLEGQFREHEGFQELEPRERQDVQESFPFIPGSSSNALKTGELACYRRAADLPVEIAEFSSVQGISRQQAAQRVVKKNRDCPKWCAYEPGIDPAGHLQELKANALEADRRAFEKMLANFQADLSKREHRQNVRLAITALLAIIVLGVIQLWAAAMSMTKDSIGYWLVARVTNAITGWLRY